MDDPKSSQSLFGPRVRIAPSPTGWFHLGTARTALFNYLFARKLGGKFIVRIEDTDKARSKKQYEENIFESLKWLGLDWDEGPDKQTEFGPYRQSERVEIYEKYIKQLLDEKKAYYCFCTPEERIAQKEDMISRGMSQIYPGKCRDLAEEVVKEYLKQGKPAIIRLKVPAVKIKFSDLIRGEIEIDLKTIGDIVIAKNLKEPLYNLSVVIDDYLMEITHVIRGEDHISNTPKQIVIQEALGFPRPIYAHLPMILGQDRSKLSKRHGVVAFTEYRKMGYFPEPMINFLALLGWHPHEDQEIFTLEELIQKFDIRRVQKGGAIFNIQKLDWFNSQYLRKIPVEQLLSATINYLKNYSGQPELLEQYSEDYIKKILEVEVSRINKLRDLLEVSDFFFKKEINYPADDLLWKEMTKNELKKSLADSFKILEEIPEKEFNRINLQVKITSFINAEPLYAEDRGKMLWPLRVALSGKKASAGPFEIAEVLGKKESLRRIEKAIEKL